MADAPCKLTLIIKGLLFNKETCLIIDMVKSSVEGVSLVSTLYQFKFEEKEKKEH